MKSYSTQPSATKSLKNLYYLPVEKRKFLNITILKIDTFVNLIAFPDSKTSAKVVFHFRRVLQ